jgi:hypothetical protein
VVLNRTEQNRRLPRRCGSSPTGTRAATPWHEQPIPSDKPCARVDSNHHGPLSPQGPQPRTRAQDASRSVRIVQTARFRGHIGRIWNSECCRVVATDAVGRCQPAGELAGMCRRTVSEMKPGIGPPYVSGAESPLSRLPSARTPSNLASVARAGMTMFCTQMGGEVTRLSLRNRVRLVGRTGRPAGGRRGQVIRRASASRRRPR